jgi:plasmid stabilization system protein ParE
LGEKPGDKESVAATSAQTKMNIQWTSKALSDLTRFHEFHALTNLQAADRTVDALSEAVEYLSDFPKMGEVIEKFHPREVRRILMEQYELRYEIHPDYIEKLRIWHTREYR